MRTFGRVIVLIAIVVAAIPLVFAGWYKYWHWSRMHWLETGAGFPRDLVISETLYTHMQVELCSEALFRLDEATARHIEERGASLLGELGPNREREIFEWRLIGDDGPWAARASIDDGPWCRGEGSLEASRDWPALPADLGDGYIAYDNHGSILVLYPSARLAVYRNQ